jgi:hypothetical protein
MKFHVTWPNGLSEFIHSECETVDAFAMSVWGKATAELVALEHRVLIALHLEEPTLEVETKVYTDGTSATGPAPLPDQSPAEQDAAASHTEPESEPAPEAPAITSESGDAAEAVAQ